MEREPKPDSIFDKLFNTERAKEEEKAQETLRKAKRVEAEAAKEQERLERQKKKIEAAEAEHEDKKRLEKAAEKVKKVLARIFDQPPTEGAVEAEIEVAEEDAEVLPDSRVSRLKKKLAELALDTRRLLAQADEQLQHEQSEPEPEMMRGEVDGLPKTESSESMEELEAQERPRARMESENAPYVEEPNPEEDIDVYAVPPVTTARTGRRGAGSAGPAVAAGAAARPVASSYASGGGVTGTGGGMAGRGISPPNPAALPKLEVAPEVIEKKSSWVPPFLLGTATGWWLGRRGPNKRVAELERDIRDLSEGKKELESELATVLHTESQTYPPQPEQVVYRHDSVPQARNEQLGMGGGGHYAQTIENRPVGRQAQANELLRPVESKVPIKKLGAAVAVGSVLAPNRAPASRVEQPKREVLRSANVMSKPTSVERMPDSPQAPEMRWLEDVKSALRADRPILHTLKPEQRNYLLHNERSLFAKAEALERKRTTSPEVQDIDSRSRFAESTLTTTIDRSADSAQDHLQNKAVDASLAQTQSPEWVESIRSRGDASSTTESTSTQKLIGYAVGLLVIVLVIVLFIAITFF